MNKLKLECLPSPEVMFLPDTVGDRFTHAEVKIVICRGCSVPSWNTVSQGVKNESFMVNT